MGYCSAPLVMPGISGTRKKNPNQAHKASPWVHPWFFPATRAKTWECHERVSKGKIKSQGILTPSCFRAKWFAGRTSPRIAPVLFAGRQNRCLLNSSEGFFFHLLKEITKNSQGANWISATGFAWSIPHGTEEFTAKEAHQDLWIAQNLWEHSPKWYRHREHHRTASTGGNQDTGF